jgi:hypothetical protein
MKKYRVHKCPHTKKDVLQLQEDNNSWLCLHNDDPTLDKVVVDAFLAGTNNKRDPNLSNTTTME